MHQRCIADAVIGGGALISVMSENGSDQKRVPSPRIRREMPFPLDYELGRPHLENGENGFFHREVPSPDRRGVW